MNWVLRAFQRRNGEPERKPAVTAWDLLAVPADDEPALLVDAFPAVLDDFVGVDRDTSCRSLGNRVASGVSTGTKAGDVRPPPPTGSPKERQASGVSDEGAQAPPSRTGPAGRGARKVDAPRPARTAMRLKRHHPRGAESPESPLTARKRTPGRTRRR